MGFFSPQKKHSCLVLKRLMDAVRAGDLMTREVVFVERTPPLDSVAETMAQHNISGVPVVGEDGGLDGMVSERDFLKLKSSRFLLFETALLSDSDLLLEYFTQPEIEAISATTFYAL